MKTRTLLIALWLMIQAAPLLAQSGQGRDFSRREVYALEIGRQDRAPAGTEETLKETLRVSGAPWLRLHAGKYNLGQKSYVLLTSLQDKGQQRLDAVTLPQWNNSTAFFNGDAVEVELHIAPGEAGIFVRFAEVTVGEWQKRRNSPQTACGTDDRVGSNDPRVGRINVQNATGAVSNPSCTAWLVSNGALLTAGHCVDSDPDQGGPMLPDGVVDAGFSGGVVEFNVPASQNNGTTVFANPNDQYPIDATRIVWRFDGNGQGLGKDWAVFGCRPNANTGLLPHQAQGSFFRMTNDNPSDGSTVRVTGYGTDTGAQNQTLQTSTGPLRGESQNGADIWLRHRVDSEGGNSGSPIIREDSGLAIGIHTNGGCNNNSNSENAGTSFEVDALETALRNFSGNSPVHVDNGHPAQTKDGNIFRPFASVTAGVNAVATGGTVSIVAGTYSDRITLSRPMTLRAPSGTVTIGK
jgi:V8-like Glu-specific endopeptidase